MYIIKYCKQEARMNTVLYSQANNPRLLPGQIFVDGGSLGSVYSNDCIALVFVDQGFGHLAQALD